MRHLLRLPLSVVLLLSASIASAAPSPLGFAPEDLAWTASDVVVVQAHVPIDGTATVLESWLGPLQPGAELRVPQLVTFAADDQRRERPIVSGLRMLEPSSKVPRDHVVPLARSVVFLRRHGTRPLWMGESLEWPPALSIAFSEAGELYGAQDTSPRRLVDAHQSEAQLRVLVEDVARRRAAIESARRRHETARLVAFTRSPVHAQSMAAVVALADCGQVALPTLRALALDDLIQPDEALDALARVAGPHAGDELVAVLAREVELWRVTAPTVPPGWWESSSSELNRLRIHYGRLLTAIWCLTKLRHAPAREHVDEARRLWRAYPALHAVGRASESSSQMVEACDDYDKAIAR